MDKLIFLGTGHALAYHCYTTCLALTDGAHTFVTDGGGGNGVFMQMERANMRPDDVTDLFISHAHTDHLIGAIWLVRVIGHQFDRSGRTTPLHVYGHASVLETFRTICNLLVGGQVLIHFAKTTQYGWRATLENGKTLVFLGDEPLTDVGLPYAKDADYLVHEAMCLEADADKYHPHRIHHSSVVDAANNATRAGAKHLILFHAEDKDLDTRKARYTAEAAAHFDGPVDAPDDLDVFIL